MRDIRALIGLLCLGLVPAARPASAQVQEWSGRAGAVRSQATVIGVGNTKILQIGADVFRDEAIRTDRNGRTDVMFLDGTQVLAGPSSEFVVNGFRYDPDRQTGQLVATIRRGDVRVLGGSIVGESPAMIFRLTGPAGAPVGQVEVENRNSGRIGRVILDLQVTEAGEAVVANLGGGSLTVTGASGGVERIMRSGFYTRLTPRSAPTPAAPAPVGMVSAAQNRLEGRTGTGQKAGESTLAAVSGQNSSIPPAAAVPGRLQAPLAGLDPRALDPLTDPARLGTVRQHSFAANGSYLPVGVDARSATGSVIGTIRGVGDIAPLATQIDGLSRPASITVTIGSGQSLSFTR